MMNMMRLLHWTAMVLALAVAGSGLPMYSAAHAQGEDLKDLMGLWMQEGHMKGDKAIYQLSVSASGIVTLRLLRTESEVGQWTVYAKEYRVNASGRDLAGTVALEFHDPYGQCNAARRTFPVDGRILPDWSMIVINGNDYLDARHCTWAKGTVSTTFVRYR